MTSNTECALTQEGDDPDSPHNERCCRRHAYKSSADAHRNGEQIGAILHAAAKPRLSRHQFRNLAHFLQFIKIVLFCPEDHLLCLMPIIARAEIIPLFKISP